MAAAFFEAVDCSDRAAACRKHGIENNCGTLGYIGRHFEIILNREHCLRITVKTYMTDLCNGYNLKKAVHHAETRAENRHNSQLFTRNLGLHGFAYGSFDFDLFKRNIPCDFICHKH